MVSAMPPAMAQSSGGVSSSNRSDLNSPRSATTAMATMQTLVGDGHHHI
jgi:hypothetical protein